MLHMIINDQFSWRNWWRSARSNDSIECGSIADDTSIEDVLKFNNNEILSTVADTSVKVQFDSLRDADIRVSKVFYLHYSIH